MVDEATTDATNSNPANPTDASGATGSNSSTTDQPTGNAADPLDQASILGNDGNDAAAGGDQASGDGATGDAAAEGADKGGDEAPALTGAPEGDYELSGLPEGTVIDKDALAAVAPIAKELNLSNAGLSKLAGVYAEQVLPAAVKTVTDNVTAQVVAQRTAWDAETRTAISGGKDAAGEAVKADPVYAGRAYDDVVTMSAKAIDRFGGADFRSFLNETGLGNHPAMMRFAYQAGALIAEDTDFVRNGNVPNTPRTREEKYYPKAG